jgi:SAM-dependent methyltransferase
LEAAPRDARREPLEDQQRTRCVLVTVTLTPGEAQRFYDWLGRRQDLQAFYEDPALEVLVTHAEFERAAAVFEFGCGTGRLAERLLSRHLRSQSLYLGVDVSSTMVDLARERLRPWSPRAEIQLSDGSLCLEAPFGRFDRFVATYVLDLLSVQDSETLLAEAHRILTPSGLLCVVSLTEGVTRAGRLVSWIWQHLYSLNAGLLGGCRPIHLNRIVSETDWTIRHQTVITAWGITSEVLVAQK